MQICKLRSSAFYDYWDILFVKVIFSQLYVMCSSIVYTVKSGGGTTGKTIYADKGSASSNLRYSFGVIPFNRLNCRLKFAKLLKPHSYAISMIVLS